MKPSRQIFACFTLGVMLTVATVAQAQANTISVDALAVAESRCLDETLESSTQAYSYGRILAAGYMILPETDPSGGVSREWMRRRIYELSGHKRDRLAVLMILKVIVDASIENDPSLPQGWTPGELKACLRGTIMAASKDIGNALHQGVIDTLPDPVSRIYRSLPVMLEEYRPKPLPPRLGPAPPVILPPRPRFPRF